MRTHSLREAGAAGRDERVSERLGGAGRIGAVTTRLLQGHVPDSSAGEVIDDAEELVGCGELERQEVGARDLSGARREQDVGAAHHGDFVCPRTVGTRGGGIDIHLRIDQLVERRHEEITSPLRGGSAGGRVPIPPHPDRVGHHRGGGVQLKSAGLVAEERQPFEGDARGEDVGVDEYPLQHQVRLPGVAYRSASNSSSSSRRASRAARRS